MNKLMISVAAVALLSATAAYADPNPACTQSCSTADQTIGNPTTTSSASNSPAFSSQSGVASASNASGVNINPTISPQTTQDAQINPVTTSVATGGAASSTGNLSNNDNKSSVGNTSASANNNANSGGNVDSHGAGTVNSSGSGNVNGGTNTTTNNAGKIDNKSSATGGAGGAGGAGGKGGDSTSASGVLASGNSANDNKSSATGGKVSGSGNSDVKTSTTTSSKNTNGQSQGQQQGQATQVKTGDTKVGGQKTAVSTGGQTTGATTTGVTTGATSVSTPVSTSIGGSSYTDNSQYVFIPSVVPATPASTLAVGNVVVQTMACGPLAAVKKTAVTGTFFGVLKAQQVNQGFTEELAPAIDATGHQQLWQDVSEANGDISRYGSQVVQTTAIIGTAGARSIALGGGSGTNWGQAGGGSSASIQQMVTTLQVKSCFLGTLTQHPANPAPAPVPPRDPALSLYLEKHVLPYLEKQVGG